LSGKSITESRLGLLFNGLLKVPMQFIILFIGVLVFVFYQFNQPPVFFNEAGRASLMQSEYKDDYIELEKKYQQVFEEKRSRINQMLEARDEGHEDAVLDLQAKVRASMDQSKEIENEVAALVVKADPTAESKDTDYVFITFVMQYLPHGIVGLLLAVIFSAAMSSTSGELNALASTTTVDFYKRNFVKDGSDRKYLAASRWFTLLWGLMAISFATFASMIENLIQAVNILGSLFYGTILGLFIVAFYIKRIGGTAVFIAAIAAELIVLFCFFFTDVAYLHFNIIGCGAVVILAILIQLVSRKSQGN
jgi:uncharacterized sodium:solute symporter family permease YidK